MNLASVLGLISVLCLLHVLVIQPVTSLVLDSDLYSETICLDFDQDSKNNENNESQEKVGLQKFNFININFESTDFIIKSSLYFNVFVFGNLYFEKYIPPPENA